MLDDLIKKEADKEDYFKKLNSLDQNTMFLDIETGEGFNQNVKDLRIKKIKSDIANEKYTSHSSYGAEANKKREDKWRESQQKKLQNAIQNVNKNSALNPLFHRIVILGYECDGKFKQMTELEAIEKEMIEEFARDCQGKTIVTYNGYSFDMFSIQLRAIQYNIPLPPYYHIDLMQKIKRWNTYENKYTICSQDILAAIFNIEPNKYSNKVDPASIGEIFKGAASGLDDMYKLEIENILKYHKEDIRLLKELYNRMKLGGLV